MNYLYSGVQTFKLTPSLYFREASATLNSTHPCVNFLDDQFFRFSLICYSFLYKVYWVELSFSVGLHIYFIFFHLKLVVNQWQRLCTEKTHIRNLQRFAVAVSFPNSCCSRWCSLSLQNFVLWRFCPKYHLPVSLAKCFISNPKYTFFLIFPTPFPKEGSLSFSCNSNNWHRIQHHFPLLLFPKNISFHKNMDFNKSFKCKTK